MLVRPTRVNPCRLRNASENLREPTPAVRRRACSCGVNVERYRDRRAEKYAERWICDADWPDGDHALAFRLSEH